MNEIGKKIVFADLQIQKGNKQKRIQKELTQNFCKLKMLNNIQDFNEVFDYLYRNKCTNIYFTVNLFPKDMNSIAEYKEAGLTNSFDYEMRWQMKILSVEKDKINLFLNYKKEFDKLILFNQYKKALDLLSTVEYQLGFSYWLLENKVFLYNILEMGTQKEIIEKAKGNVLASILSFYDMRSSNEVSSRDYDYFTRKEIEKFKKKYPDKKRIISFYHYMIAPFTFTMDDKNVLSILSVLYNFPLIDRYLYIIDLCEYILANGEKTGYKMVLQKYINYLEEIIDPCVDVFRFLLDNNENRKQKYCINDPLLKIKNQYIDGAIEDCYQNIVFYLEQGTTNVQAFNIYIEICQMLKKEVVEIHVSDNIKMILKNLNLVYSIDQNYNDAIYEIYKLCFSCIHATWARDIFNHITRRSQPYNSPLQKIAVLYTNMQRLTFETVGENLKEEAVDFLKSTCYKDNKYIEFWIYYVMSDFREELIKVGLEPLNVLIKLKDSTDYCSFKKELLENQNIVPIYKIRYTKIMWDNMAYDTYIEEGLDYFIHLFLFREEIVVIAPMYKFMEYFSTIEHADKSNLRVPILYYIYATYFDVNKREDLTIICEDFFFYNSIEKPSMMEAVEEKYSKEALIFFLRYICIPQFMGPVLLSIKNSKDLDQERINTCQYLRTLDSKNESVYEQEIKEITHKLFINEGLSSIENSKIHVNTEGIKSRISKELISTFNYYMYSRNHKIDAVLETIKNIEGGEKVKIISFDATQMFSEIVYAIRNEFVSSGEYGLDGYLSLNIRHGTLADQLRAPLAKYDLLVTYMIETESYEVCSRWLFKIQSYLDRKNLEAAIVKFNKETDEIIEYLRKTLIQISTEEKISEGVFDYSLDVSNINYLQTLLTENTKLEEFIDKVFDYLWNITEHNLERMKSIIREEIKQKYISAFAKLSNVIKGIHEKNPFPEAIRWLNEAQNDIDAELEKICNWFKRSAESQHADFDLDLAFQIGYKMIENIHPEKNFAIRELNKDLVFKIPGAYLRNYWNIFYTLFDNVSKYALEIDGVKNIYCDLTADSSLIYIRMVNDYDCVNGVEKEEAKIRSALNLISDKTYLARAQQEGGSGIPKIYKILAVDLDKKPDIKCYFDYEKNQFIIEIEGRSK